MKIKIFILLYEKSFKIFNHEEFKNSFAHLCIIASVQLSENCHNEEIKNIKANISVQKKCPSFIYIKKLESTSLMTKEKII